MAQTYTLEEAAQRLSISPEEMKRKLKDDWKHLRSFRDGPTLRFRAADIDELARTLGATSDHGLQLADLPPPEPGSDAFKLAEPTPPPKSAAARKPAAEEPVNDIFSLAAEAPPAPPPRKQPDSDVRLEAAKPKPKSSGRIADSQSVIPTEEIALDFSGPGSAIIKGGSSAKLSAPKSNARLSSPESGKNKLGGVDNVNDSSEFELSLDADSDEFEMQLNTDDSDEVDIGGPAKGGRRSPGESGINLRDPADSGINLEKRPAGSGRGGKSNRDSDDDMDFELSLDPGGPMPGLPGGSSTKLGGGPMSSSRNAGKSGILPPKTGKFARPGGSSGGGPKSGARSGGAESADSEFELTLDDATGSGASLDDLSLGDSGERKDIFETDFEIPPMTDEDADSGSGVVALEGSDTDLEADSSDFDIALNDNDVVADDEGSGSQVVLLDDEADAPPRTARTKKSPRPSADDEDHEVDFSDVQVEDDDIGSALKGAKSVREMEDEEEDEEEAVAPSATVAAPAPWGIVPALFLAPAFGLVLVGMLMGYELLHTMWGYQQPKPPTAPIVRGLASTFEMDVKDQ